jgi:hypothetical protein
MSSEMGWQFLHLFFFYFLFTILWVVIRYDLLGFFVVSGWRFWHLHRLLCVFRGMAGLDSDLDLDLDIISGIYWDWDFVYYL